MGRGLGEGVVLPREDTLNAIWHEDDDERERKVRGTDSPDVMGRYR